MSAFGNNPGANMCDLDSLSNNPTDEFNYRDVVDGKWEPGQSMQDVGPFSHANEWMLYQPPTKENESLMRTRQVYIFITNLYLFLAFCSVGWLLDTCVF